MKQLVWRDTLAVAVPSGWDVSDGDDRRSLDVAIPGMGEMTILCARREHDEDDDDTELAYMLAMDAAARHDWDLEHLRIDEFAVNGCPTAEVATIRGETHHRVWHIVGPDRVALITLDGPLVPEDGCDPDDIERVVRSIRWLHTSAN